MTTEVWCRKCSNHGFLKRPPRDNEACPTCDAPLFKRREDSPTPWNHVGPIFKALFSVRALLFIGIYAVAVEIPHPVFRVAMAVLLFLAASAFASRTASVGADRYIDFPHISFEELLSIKAILSMAVYVVGLVLGPLILIASAVAANLLPFEVSVVPPVWLAFVLAGALFLWSPMALVLYLRTGSLVGFFLVPQGIKLIFLNFRGYLLLSFLVLSAQALLVAVYVANTVVPFPLSIGLSAVKAVLVFAAYGAAGLYVRQYARVLDFPVDEEDWIPISPPIEVNFRDVRTFRPTNPDRAIEIDEDANPSVPANFLRSSEMAPDGGSWPPTPSKNLAPQRKTNVPDRAREAGIAPLEDGEWLSADVDAYMPSQPGQVSVSTSTSYPSISDEPVSGLDSSSSTPTPAPQNEENAPPAAADEVPTAAPAQEVEARPMTPEEQKAAWVAALDPTPPPQPLEPMPEEEPSVADSPQAPTTASGTALGRYVLTRKVAEGGMAEIFWAEQRGPADYAKPVVIKRMRRQLTTEPEVVQMFLDEARLGAQLNHPNIVQVIDFGEVDGEYFIAMERLEGKDFGELLTRGPLPVDMACLLISQACEGLAYAHRLTDDAGQQRNVVHRDISPANLFLARPGVVKVLDFGIARATERNTKTQTGMVKGKPAFMSPEQVRGQSLDGRSDVFSLGTTLFQMVTGVNPFFRDSDFDTGAAVVQERQPTLDSFDLVFPEGFEAVLKGALRKHVDKRYADAIAFKTALKPFLPKGSESDALHAFLVERSS